MEWLKSRTVPGLINTVGEYYEFFYPYPKKQNALTKHRKQKADQKQEIEGGENIEQSMVGMESNCI